MDIVTKVLQKEREKARTIVEALIDSEMNYLFTNNRDFKDNSSIMMPGGQSQQSSGNVFVDQLRARVDNYFSIVLRNVKDSIPKAIGYFLVRKSQEKLQMALFDSMNQNKRMTETLGEPAHITERREFLTTRLDLMKNSMKVLQRDPE